MYQIDFFRSRVPPSGGSLEIGNIIQLTPLVQEGEVPPSGGSLEIGNTYDWLVPSQPPNRFPLRGDP